MADPADDSLTEDIWASPTTTKPTQYQPPERPKTPKTPTRPASPTYDHEAALRKELEGVRGVNHAIEGLIGTLERAKGNMNVSGFQSLVLSCTFALFRDRSRH
jgi:hypothetical protein